MNDSKQKGITMANFKFGFVTPIWETDYSYIKEMVESVNRLFKSGILFNWGIVIDGDKRDVDDFLRQIIDPLLLPNCSIINLDRHYGPSFARNFGVKSLDCEFVSWLDADDAIDTQNFTIVFNELSSKDGSFWNKYDLVYTDSYDCDLHLNIVSIREKKFIHDLHCKYKNTEIDPLLGVDFVYQMQFIRKKTFLSVGGFNEQLIFGEDVDLILKISEKSRNVNFYYLQVPVYYYRDNPNGRCNIEWEKLKIQMEKVYLDSSQRQGFSFPEYEYIGEFVLFDDFLQYIKNNGSIAAKSLYDIYLPIDENNRIMTRPYIKAFAP